MCEGEAMKDIECRLLEKYWVDVNHVRKVRSGFLCDTNQGLFRIKELSSSVKKTPYVQYICQQLKENGYEHVDIMLLNKEGELVCDMRDHGQYVLKHWFMGRECDIYKERELMIACEQLAELHNCLDRVSGQIVQMQEDLQEDERWNQFIATDLLTEWNRHNQGLKKARRYMRNRVNKGEFETIYLDKFEEFYEVADQVVCRLQETEYDSLYSEAIEKKYLVHGDYNYHNMLFVGANVAMTNFERFRVDIPVSDFYYFLRKVMEKYDWNEDIGYKMIESYGGKRGFSDSEYAYIALRLSYPEKLWKLTNYYYNTNKAWISEKNVEKLRISIEQMTIKQQFVHNIFAFHL